MKRYTILILCLFSLSMYGQNKSSRISGFITDKFNNPLPEAVIKFYQFRDSFLIKTIRASGKGYFEVDQKDSTYLIISYTGFKPRRINLAVAKGSLGQIALQTDTFSLNQVTITSRQPIIQQKLDKSIITVNSQVLKLADNALDVIKLAPGIVISDNEDAIGLNGKDAVQIMMNGKVVKMSSRDLVKMLKSMPAQMVNQLEVMNNPSAKYDVPGNTALLNIKTNNTLKGVSGNIDLESSQALNNMGDFSGILNYGSDRLSTSAYLAYHYGKYQTYYDKLSTLNNAFLNQKNTNLDKWSDPVIRMSIDYYLTKKATLGGVIEREKSSNIGTYQTDSHLKSYSGRDSSFLTTGYSPNVRKWNTYNLNYRFLDTVGTELSIDLDRADYQKKDESNVVNMMPSTQQNGFRYNTLTTISINTFKADFIQNWRYKLKLEAGLKTSWVTTKNNLAVHKILNDSIRMDFAQLDNFRYEEQVNSVYTNLGKEFKHWGIQFGLRLEESRIKGTSLVADKPDSNYLNLLPTIYLTWQPFHNHGFRLSLNQRIKRPDYNDLQPFAYQLDPFNYQIGNPGLRVQHSTNVEFTYTYSDRVTLTLSHTRITDFFNPILVQTASITYHTTQNAGDLDNWNFDLNYPVRVNKWWTMLNKINGFYNHFDGLLFQGSLNIGKWSAIASTNQRFTLPNKFMLQMSVRYNSPTQNLIYQQGSSSNVSVSLNRKILRDQGTFRIGMSDIFKTQRNNVLVNFGNLNYIEHNTWESQRFSAAFTWRFGNTNVKKAANRDRANGEEKGRSN